MMNELTTDQAAAVSLGMRHALAGLHPQDRARLCAALADARVSADLRAQHTQAATRGVEAAQDAEAGPRARLQAQRDHRAAQNPGWKALVALHSMRPVATTMMFRDTVERRGPGAVPELVARTLQETGRTWYSIRTRAAADTAEIHLLDEVGEWGVTAQDFIRDLQGIDAGEIAVHINSPGGEVFQGLTIMNALRSHPAFVHVYVGGLAASIASVIAMAGDVVTMRPHSQLMIHDGSGICMGNAAEMRAAAASLDRQSDNIAAVYAEKAGGTVGQWRERMRAETWYTAEEAVAAGLADEVA
ncbi:head maturation protease, ClpP-related [Streptomyces syringium]|uniref:head maturation protease, ClpP-related n=1 Tax=Streptomyces syringium TaxID=76729 RepID=UPI0036E68402